MNSKLVKTAVTSMHIENVFILSVTYRVAVIYFLYNYIHEDEPFCSLFSAFVDVQPLTEA